MKAIVTGGAGFIGSHLVDLLLDRGHDVTVIDTLATGRRKNIERHKHHPDCYLMQIDVRHRRALDSLFDGVDWVFHLAAMTGAGPSVANPVDCHETNVQGTVNVLESARLGGAKRFIYAASSSCYGFPEICPTPETAEIRPRHPYALSKALGEQTVLHWNEIYGMPALSLRLFSVYGPRSRIFGMHGAVSAVFLAQKLAGQPFTVVGDGYQTRDFMFVKDAAKAFLAAAESGVSGRAYNVGTGRPVSINRIVELLGGPVVNVPNRPGEPDTTEADIARIKGDLGWMPETTIEQGVAEMLRLIDDWKGEPVWTPESIAEAVEERSRHSK